MIRTYLVYNTVVHLCQFFCCGGKANLVQIFLLNPRIFFSFLLLCMDLQPYSHNYFSKILRTLFDFLNNTYWVFFILEKQLANIPDRGFLFLHNTLLLYSLSPYSQTESQTETQIRLLRVGWRNLFFQLCCTLCQFLVLAGKRIWFTYSCT